MSYDLHAFRLPPGVTAREFYESEERELEEDSAPTPEEREAMERLAEAVAAVDPAAERHDGDDFIELSGEAMQVSLYAREAAISIPYWFEGAEADAAMAKALEYARVLREVGGYTVFDSQTEEVVGEAGEPADAKRAYAAGTAAADRVPAEDRPRWWQFWRR